MKKIKIDVTGMHCASCSTLIDRALNKVDGVKSANVNLTTNKATIEYDKGKTNEAALVSTIQNKGYGARIVSENDQSIYGNKQRKEYLKLKRSFFFSLLFAGQVFADPEVEFDVLNVANNNGDILVVGGEAVEVGFNVVHNIEALLPKRIMIGTGAGRRRDRNKFGDAGGRGSR